MQVLELISKHHQHGFLTLKRDMVANANSDMLITKWIGIFPRFSPFSSTSKFEFLEQPYARVVCIVYNSKLNSRVTRIYSTSLTFLVDAHSNLYNAGI